MKVSLNCNFIVYKKKFCSSTESDLLLSIKVFQFSGNGQLKVLDQKLVMF